MDFEDHFVPASDRISADNVIQLTKWAKKMAFKSILNMV